jgi:hypothetical protein
MITHPYFLLYYSIYVTLRNQAIDPDRICPRAEESVREVLASLRDERVMSERGLYIGL